MLEFHQLKKIHLQSEEIHKTALMLSMYCKAYGNLEGIYSITSVVQYLAKSSDDMYYELCKLMDKGETNDLCDFDD